LTISLIGQDRFAQGYVLDKDTHQSITDALVVVAGTDIFDHTNETGNFKVEVPKKHHQLLISKDGYNIKKVYLKPDFQIRRFKIELRPLSVDSLFLTFKNVLTISPIELIGGALAIRYERFLALKHSIGLHSSFYLFGRSVNLIGSEFDYYCKFHGFKLNPFYRFYPIRKGSFGLFVDARFSFAYIHFSKLDYHYESLSNPREYIDYSFTTIGGGISIGVMLKLPKTEKVVINISAGYQYLPIDVPESVKLDFGDGTILSLPTDTGWWYRFGPGARFDLKFTLGGIF